MKNDKIIDPLLGGEPGKKPVTTPIKPVASDKPAEKPVKFAKQATVIAAVDTVAETKAILDKQEHINFIIPMSDGEKAGAFETIQINGYKLNIQKGVLVSLPKSVVNLLAEKYQINMIAGADKRIDRDTATTEALS